MNSKAAQLRENGTEIVRLFARFALGASFLSAVADRFGLWGPYGAKNVSWGNFAHFVEYTGKVTALFPSSSTVSFAWASHTHHASVDVAWIQTTHAPNPSASRIRSTIGRRVAPSTPTKYLGDQVRVLACSIRRRRHLTVAFQKA